VAAPPLDGIDYRLQMKLGPAGPALLPEEFHKTVIASRESKGTVTVNRVRGSVLLCERFRADTIHSSSVESFHVTRSHLPGILINVKVRDELRKRLIGQIGIGQPLEDLIGSPKEAGPAHRPTVLPVLMPFRHLLDRQARCFCNRKNRPRFPMDEFGAEFDRNTKIRITKGMDSPADPVALPGSRPRRQPRRGIAPPPGLPRRRR